jgi:plasmid stabilization system protein ParE
MPRKREKQTEQGKAWITAVVTQEVFDYLSKLKGPRSWPRWFTEIQSDFKKLADENRDLREQLRDLEDEIRDMKERAEP